MAPMPLRVLVADDDSMIRDMLQEILDEMGMVSDTVSTAAAAVATAAKGEYDLVMLDLGFPDCRDLSTLRQIREVVPETDVMMVTSRVEDLDVVAEAVRLGCFDYVPKPLREQDIRIRVTRLRQARVLARTCEHAIRSLAQGSRVEDIVGNSQAMQKVRRLIGTYAATDVPVLVTGETGTGKELVARALHYGGPRRGSPFHCLNCAALAPSLVQAELFGHEKGAFTGAVSRRQGAFELAADGTLFLDEIGDMDLASQSNLLRVLESGTYKTVGGGARVNHARIVTATNHDLEAAVKEGRFRQDLYYRVKRGTIQIPPLRERREDIPPLVEFFLRDFNQRMGKAVKHVPEEVMQALVAHEWLGNVRELRNEIERAYIAADGSNLRLLDLSPEILAAPATRENDDALCFRLEEFKAQAHIKRVVDALKASNGNVGKAAGILGVHRNTMSRWLKRYGLSRS